jgi:hypothetical protein
MLAHLPVTAPLWRATADATWVLKAEMAWGVGGTALAVYALLRFLGLAGFAAALGAAAVALEPGRINPLGTMVGVAAQPQYLGFQYAPLALLAILVWSRERRRLGFAALAVALALQSLACFYLGYYAFLTVPLFATYVLAQRRGPGELAALAASLLAGALLALPVALQYLAARRSGAVRPPDPELPYLGSIAGAGVAAGAAWIGPLGLALGAIALAATLARRRRGVAEGVASAATDTVARGALILAVAAIVWVARSVPSFRFG